MFEQSTLAPGPAGKRVWTTLMGFSSQVFLVGTAVLAPMVWPQVLPKAQLWTALQAPLPPPAPPAPRPRQMGRQPSTTTAVPRTQFHANMLYAPTRIPAKPVMIEDPPDVGVVGMADGMRSSAGNGVVGSIVNELARAVPFIEPPKPPAAPIAAAPVATGPIPVVPGGRVQLGRLLHRVEPAYPTLARAARQSGTVELEAVVGTDGRVKEVKVKSGSPLLTRAAADAVLQWVYEPTQLNGKPVELLAVIVVTFKLN